MQGQDVFQLMGLRTRHSVVLFVVRLLYENLLGFRTMLRHQASQGEVSVQPNFGLSCRHRPFCTTGTLYMHV